MLWLPVIWKDDTLAIHEPPQRNMGHSSAVLGPLSTPSMPSPEKTTWTPVHRPTAGQTWGIVTGRFLEKGIHLNQVTGRFFEPNDLLPGQESAWWKQGWECHGCHGMPWMQETWWRSTITSCSLWTWTNILERRSRMQSKGCFRISKKRRKNEEKMRKYVALAPRKAVALNLTSWCHMCRSLKTLMPCSAPSTWKRCFRNCVIPCVSNIPWSEIFSGSVSESRMTYCQILVLHLRCKRGLHHPTSPFRLSPIARRFDGDHDGVS